MLKIYESGNPDNYIEIEHLKKTELSGLWITFKNNTIKVCYKDGILFDTDNKKYNGKGVKTDKSGKVRIKNSFLKKTVKALNKIAKAEKEINTNIISTLQSSKFLVIIKESTINMFDPRGIIKKNFSVETKRKLAMRINNASYIQGKYLKKGQVGGTKHSNNIGSGGLVKWHHKNGVKISTNKGIKPSDPIIALAHELFHAYDAKDGNLVWSIYKGTEIKEIRASYFGNLLRKTTTFNKDYFRTYYNDKGFYLLDSNNYPRTVEPTVKWSKK